MLLKLAKILDLFVVIFVYSSASNVEDLGNDAVYMEHARLARRFDVSRKGRADATKAHKVIFVVKNQNLDKLQEILFDVSDIDSPNYGQHLSMKDVEYLTANPTAADYVRSYLSSLQDLGVSYEVLTSAATGAIRHDYIEASAPIAVWESMFSTVFYEFDQVDGVTQKIHTLIRALDYSIPSHLKSHIEGVFGCVDFPRKRRQRIKNLDLVSSLPNTAMSPSSDATTDDGWWRAPSYLGNTYFCPGPSCFKNGYVTPKLINDYHGIKNNMEYSIDMPTNARVSQAVFESGNETFAKGDLSMYFSYFGIPHDETMKYIYGGHMEEGVCNPPGTCGEAGLDVQILMSTSQGTPTTFFYDSGTFYGMLLQLSSEPHIPKILSISYGTQEYSMTALELSQFDIEAQKLSVRGVTLIASAGDDGVADNEARNPPEGSGIWSCGYQPDFPNTSPYVVSVGGTQGPETFVNGVQGEEVVCQGDKGGVITSGGGFSNFQPRPAWQQNEVLNYFSNISHSGKTIKPGYNKYGRGYPDVTGLAYNYLIFDGGKTGAESGTSASAPLFASMLSLVNAARAKQGKGTVGYINPALYELHRRQSASNPIFKDITDGFNNCVVLGEVCCDEGFYAAPSWDPTSGLGSIRFQAFKDAIVALGNATRNSTSQPLLYSLSPTLAPSILPAGITAMPSASPTFMPGSSSLHLPVNASTLMPPGWLFQSTYALGSTCTSSAMSGTINQIIAVPTGQCRPIFGKKKKNIPLMYYKIDVYKQNLQSDGVSRAVSHFYSSPACLSSDILNSTSGAGSQPFSFGCDKVMVGGYHYHLYAYSQITYKRNFNASVPPGGYVTRTFFDNYTSCDSNYGITEIQAIRLDTCIIPTFREAFKSTLPSYKYTYDPASKSITYHSYPNGDCSEKGVVTTTKTTSSDLSSAKCYVDGAATDDVYSENDKSNDDQVYGYLPRKAEMAHKYGVLFPSYPTATPTVQPSYTAGSPTPQPSGVPSIPPTPSPSSSPTTFSRILFSTVVTQNFKSFTAKQFYASPSNNVALRMGIARSIGYGIGYQNITIASVTDDTSLTLRQSQSTVKHRQLQTTAIPSTTIVYVISTFTTSFISVSDATTKVSKALTDSISRSQGGGSTQAFSIYVTLAGVLVNSPLFQSTSTFTVPELAPAFSAMTASPTAPPTSSPNTSSPVENMQLSALAITCIVLAICLPCCFCFIYIRFKYCNLATASESFIEAHSLAHAQQRHKGSVHPSNGNMYGEESDATYNPSHVQNASL